MPLLSAPEIDAKAREFSQGRDFPDVSPDESAFGTMNRQAVWPPRADLWYHVDSLVAGSLGYRLVADTKSRESSSTSRGGLALSPRRAARTCSCTSALSRARASRAWPRVTRSSSK